jgi:hypothetical protein
MGFAPTTGLFLALRGVWSLNFQLICEQIIMFPAGQVTSDLEVNISLEGELSWVPPLNKVPHR